MGKDFSKFIWTVLVIQKVKGFTENQVRVLRKVLDSECDYFDLDQKDRFGCDGSDIKEA